MTILINDQEVDFTLEGGENAIQIYQAISSWLKESAYLIYSFVLDGEETDPELSEIWENRKASDINKIEVTALSEKEYMLSGLLTVAEYINLLLRSVTNDKKEVIQDLMLEYPSIIKNIPVLVRGSQGELISSHLNNIITESGLLNNNFNNEYKKVFLAEIVKISELLNSAAREIEDPKKELKATYDVIEKLIPRINEVSILLQTGKDKEAMSLIITLTELLQKILRIISLFNTDNVNIDGGTYGNFSTALNEVFIELAEAFDANDSVLIGDLLEYEISPRLELLPDLISTVKLIGEE